MAFHETTMPTCANLLTGNSCSERLKKRSKIQISRGGGAKCKLIVTAKQFSRFFSMLAAQSFSKLTVQFSSSLELCLSSQLDRMKSFDGILRGLVVHSILLGGFAVTVTISTSQIASSILASSDLMKKHTCFFLVQQRCQGTYTARSAARKQSGKSHRQATKL